MHRTTVKLFELADAHRDSGNWPARRGLIRLLMTTFAGLALATFGTANLGAQDGPDSASKSPSNSGAKQTAPKDAKTPAKAAKADDSDSADAGDQSQSVFTMSDPKTTDEDWKKWNDGSGRADYTNRIHNGDPTTHRCRPSATALRCRSMR